ncbi:MAG: hypothetical protein Q9167_007698 [Letrouitia subvulpina]
MACIRSDPGSSVFNDKTVRWEASKQFRVKCEKYVAKAIPGATSIKVVATVMTDEIADTREDYICIHGVELNPYPQAFMGLGATISLDESLGMANTTPVKDVLGINVKGAVKSTVGIYYIKKTTAQDNKVYPSFRDGVSQIISSLDPKKPIVVAGHSMGAAIAPLVVADIYDAHKADKPDVSLINFAPYKSADAEFSQQILDWGTDAASYRVQDDPVTNVTGIFSLLKGIAESFSIPMILNYKKEIEAERQKSKTKDIGTKYVYSRFLEGHAQNKIGIALHGIKLLKQLITDMKHFSGFKSTKDDLDPSFVNHPDATKAYYKDAKEKWEDMAAFFRYTPDIHFDNPV